MLHYTASELLAHTQHNVLGMFKETLNTTKLINARHLHGYMWQYSFTDIELMPVPFLFNSPYTKGDSFSLP